MISPRGFVTVWSEENDKNTTLGSIIVSGLIPKQASSKSKGFWGKGQKANITAAEKKVMKILSNAIIEMYRSKEDE
ncbi:MAG: hypothetical protein GY777_32140 [Candidatus Brocadiaceae bacterium]|nr:hypothetical protein [Candidatus Brocadiaceae bacterium]